jgi:hypothetical protein
LFYASRTLPNTFALILGDFLLHISSESLQFHLVLWVYEKWLDGKNHHWIILATVATFLFRCELALLFGPFFLAALFLSKYRFYAAFWMLLIGLSTLLVTLGWFSKLLYGKQTIICF